MKDFKDLTNDFNKAVADVKKLEASRSRLAGITAVKIIKQNFALQGFDTGKGINAWKERGKLTNIMYDTRLGVKGSTINSKNKLLMQTRKLYNNIRYVVNSDGRVFIGVDLQRVPYAKIHNEGGVTHPKVTGKMIGLMGEAFKQTGEETFQGISQRKGGTLNVKIPQRKYLGWSEKMKQAIITEYDKRLNKAMEKFKK